LSSHAPYLKDTLPKHRTKQPRRPIDDQTLGVTKHPLAAIQMQITRGRRLTFTNYTMIMALSHATYSAKWIYSTCLLILDAYQAMDIVKRG